MSSHGGTSSSQPLGDANAGSSPSSTGSNGNNGNQGGTNNSNGPQGPAPDRNYFNKLMFTYSTTGGPLQHGGIESRIRAGDVVHFTGPDANLRLRSVRLLLRPDIIEQVTNDTHFAFQHNDRLRVQTIVNGMSLFMLTRPNTVRTPGNFTMLEDYVQSSEEICRLLVGHLEYADTLAPEDLPLEVALLFFGERMHTQPHAVTGLFECVRKINDANAVVILYGLGANGVQIVDPVVVQPPVIAPVPTAQVNQPPVQGGAPPTAPVAGAVQDPNAALIQGVLVAIPAMTQVNMQLDQRNAIMTQQQSQLQTGTMQANAQQLQHLTNHLGNLGTEVGKAIASHPTHIQATLSHPSAIPGQSNDPWQLGSLTRPIPVGMSVQGLDYGPYAGTNHLRTIPKVTP